MVLPLEPSDGLFFFGHYLLCDANEPPAVFGIASQPVTSLAVSHVPQTDDVFALFD
jgi:hypothetical protein